MKPLPDDHDVSNVFATPDFWKSPTWPEASSTIGDEGLSVNLFNLALDSGTANAKRTAADLDGDSFFKLPALLAEPPTGEAPQDEGPSLEVPYESCDRISGVGWAESEDDGDDWLAESSGLALPPKLLSWDSFSFPGTQDGAPLFISEAGPAAFDALLASTNNPFQVEANDSYKTLEAGAFCGCLLALSLGRASVLFLWDDGKKTFEATPALTKVSGYSGETIRGLTELCLECGSANRLLRGFVEATYARRASPSMVALANAVDKLLLVVQGELGARGRAARSLLQLQAVVQPVHALATYFDSLVGRLSRAATDEAALALLFREAQSAEYGHAFLRDTVREVLVMVSRPWTDFVEAWLGLKEEQGRQLGKDGPGRGFVRVESRAWANELGLDLEERDYVFDDEGMPGFVPADVAQAIFETGRNLRFLRDHHPDHPLAHPGRCVEHPPSLEWQFGWDAIERVGEKATAYERALAEAVRQHRSPLPGRSDRRDDAPADGRPFGLQFFGLDEAQIEKNMAASIAELGQPAARAGGTTRLAAVLGRQLFRHSEEREPPADDDFTPHWSLLPLLSFGPIVSAQARLVNRECLRLLFSTHGLREHLHLLREFALFGNGVFSSRLSHALFDPDLDATERQAGVARSGGVMGLRLGGRDTWPPASSELRLALMGILAESYAPRGARPGRAGGGPRGGAKQELPGDMSFAVRELGPEEMDRCMDADSVEALDFLQLSYRPPPALLPVVPPALLVKYDRIFRHLLRVLRMLYVVDRVFSDAGGGAGRRRRGGSAAAQRFRIESHHFVYSVAAYFLDTGTATPWRGFEAWLDGVQASLEADADGAGEDPSAAGRTSGSCSPDRLLDRHGRTLDDMMRAMLLRKRQQPVLRLLDDIFTVILQFAKTLREQRRHGHGHGRDDGGGGDEVRALYAAFRKKVEVFLTVCKGLGEKASYETRREKGPSGGTGTERVTEETPVTKLVLMLDMSNYYTRREPS